MPAILVVVIAYLLGSLSGSLILGRFVGVDIRTRGSGNAGGTNAFRTLGWKFALGVLLVDVGKGALAAWLGLQFADAPQDRYPLAYACVMAAVAGHTWPLFFGFRGGKGAGTLVGGLLLAWPASVPWLLLVWVGVLVATGYVGLATILAGLALLPIAWWHGSDTVRFAFALVAALFLLYSHRANVVRLLRGNENRFERVRFWKRWARRA